VLTLIDKIKKERLAQRLILYLCGLFILAFGVVFSINAGLGVSPVATTPYITSLIFNSPVGMWTTVLMCFFVLTQILILRRKFKLISLMQIPVSFIFGYFVDSGRWILEDLIMQGFILENYFARLGMLAASIFFISSGIILLMDAKFVNMPPEEFCAVIADKLPNGKFHIIKMIMDSALVVVGIGLSLVFLGEILGIREGTIISAVAIGKVIPFLRKVWAPVLRFVKV
jgi:uncharacterized membrane protein YczE